MREVRAKVPSAPEILCFHTASVAAGEAFFKEHAPEVAAVSDKDAFFFKAFGYARGSLRQLAGPAVWAAAIRAMRGGHRVGKPSGDVLRMPGVVGLKGREVIQALHFDHIGDHRGVERLIKDLAVA